MVKVANRKTLFLITKRILEMNRKRNVLAVTAIMLTALLFTSLFTGSESLILTKRATEIRQFMSSSHVTVQDLTPEQGERAETAIKESRDVKRYGKGIFLGGVVNPEFNFSAEMRYADKNMAESFNCIPTKGHLPKAENEIAVSSLVLDRLGVPHRIGQKINIAWERNQKETVTDEFIVTGYWEGDKAVLSQLLFVSKEYALKNSNVPDEVDIENGNFNGVYDYALWYDSLWKLREKTEKLNLSSQMESAENRFEVNPAYDLMEEDSFSFGALFILILFIILCGYLIIYNVFNLSVRNDIRAYGLLKNIGTTGSQLKKIVRLQALLLSLAGIPVGIVAGYLAGMFMAPSINADGDFANQIAGGAVVKADPIVFVAAALLTLLTVYLSCLQSCRMVGRVSPIEALRLADHDRFRVGRTKKRKKEISTKWYAMAVRNIVEEWKKGILVMLSIALSMVVVNCTVMLVKGYDFEQYSKIFLVSDFKLDRLTGTLSTSNLEGIDTDMKKVIEQCPDSEETGFVYYSSESHEMEEPLLDLWTRFATEYEEYWNDYEKELWKKVMDSKKISVHLIGVNEAAFNKLEWKGDPCSWEEFSTGKYIITDYNRDLEEPNSYYKKNDRVNMNFKEGSEKKYEVLGEAMMPYSMDYPFADMLFITVMLPETEFMKQTGIDSAMYCTIDAADGKANKVSAYIENKVKKQNDMINCISIFDMKESFDKYIDKYYYIGAFLTIILLFIGIMNFYNTTATSIASRKRELTLLEVVGMKKKNIIWMLIAEGFVYFIGAFILAVTIICFASESILSHTIGQAFFFHMQLTAVPCVLMIPMFLIVAIVIPYRQYNSINRESIVERIEV